MSAGWSVTVGPTEPNAFAAATLAAIAEGAPDAAQVALAKAIIAMMVPQVSGGVNKLSAVASGHKPTGDADSYPFANISVRVIESGDSVSPRRFDPFARF